MPIFSHLHQLLHADTCHASIHRLRWKDRPLQCPRRQSDDVGPWGTYHYRPRCKRYRCRACKRTFNDLTGTLCDRSKRSLAHWMLATFAQEYPLDPHRLSYRYLGEHRPPAFRFRDIMG